MAELKRNKKKSPNTMKIYDRLFINNSVSNEIESEEGHERNIFLSFKMSVADSVAVCFLWKRVSFERLKRRK